MSGGQRTPLSQDLAVFYRGLAPFVIVYIGCTISGSSGSLVKTSNSTTKFLSNAKLQCAPENSDEPVTVVWYKDGNKLSETGSQKYSIDKNNFTLSVTKVGEPEIGEYVCQVQGVNYTVHIFCEPFVKPFERSKNLIEGDNLELNCVAFGWPMPTLTWFGKENTQLFANERISFENNSVFVNATLKIKSVVREDYMEYTCSASNDIGRPANATILVRVKDSLAPLWPFLGIIAELVILFIIIFIYERSRAKQRADEASKEEAELLTNSAEHKGASAAEDRTRLRK